MSQSYHQRAVECRTMAEKTSDPEEKTAWLKLAEDWANLANEVDRMFQPQAPVGDPGRPGLHRRPPGEHSAPSANPAKR